MTQRSQASKDMNKKKMRCNYYRDTYGVEIDPNDKDAFNFFVNNRKLILQSMPLLEKLIEFKANHYNCQSPPELVQEEVDL